jgi:hypothetical protein
MSTIHEQIEIIHQQARELVEGKYPEYRVSAVRNNSSTFYAQETTSIVELSVEAVKEDKDLYCHLAFKNNEMSIVSATKGKSKHFS